jgi:hypothetical protein
MYLKNESSSLHIIKRRLIFFLFLKLWADPETLAWIVESMCKELVLIFHN